MYTGDNEKVRERLALRVKIKNFMGVDVPDNPISYSQPAPNGEHTPHTTYAPSIFFSETTDNRLNNPQNG